MACRQDGDQSRTVKDRCKKMFCTTIPHTSSNSDECSSVRCNFFMTRLQAIDDAPAGESQQHQAFSTIKLSFRFQAQVSFVSHVLNIPWQPLSTIFLTTRHGTTDDGPGLLRTAVRNHTDDRVIVSFATVGQPCFSCSEPS